MHKNVRLFYCVNTLVCYASYMYMFSLCILLKKEFPINTLALFHCQHMHVLHLAILLEDGAKFHTL